VNGGNVADVPGVPGAMTQVTGKTNTKIKARGMSQTHPYLRITQVWRNASARRPFNMKRFVQFEMGANEQLRTGSVEGSWTSRSRGRRRDSCEHIHPPRDGAHYRLEYRSHDARRERRQRRDMPARGEQKRGAGRRVLSPPQRAELLGILKARFAKHVDRHRGLDWADVQARLELNPAMLWSINEMERTGGEPDVIGRDNATGEYIFYDCSAESPAGRRSVCYDRQALESRKEHKPRDSAIEMATAMGVEILTETQYRELQTAGSFDAKTSSWVQTPPEIRRLGGAIFCDRRYNHVFTYHNGAESYYAARGFRASLRV
jgi:hypothetical protein